MLWVIGCKGLPGLMSERIARTGQEACLLRTGGAAWAAQVAWHALAFPPAQFPSTLTPPMSAPEFINAGDGRRIDMLTWLPEAPRAVVQIAHGMGEHAGRYDRLARALVRQGYAVYANHHRGHGPRAADAGMLGNLGPGGFARLVEDMADVSRCIRERHPRLSLVLIGHSMGSFAAQAYALSYSSWLQALVLSGTAATDLAAEDRRSGRRELAQAKSANQPPRTPWDWLTRDDAEVDKYMADPLCGFPLEPSSLASMYATCAPATVPGGFSGLRPTLPIYLVTGSCDPVNDHLRSFHPLVRRLRDAGLTRVTEAIYEGARHEVFNETNRDEVVDAMLAWLETACRF